MISLPHSFKTRVTVFTLVIFVLSIWSLAFYVSRMLRQDMEHLLGEQQFSTASLVASEIDQLLGVRLHELKEAADSIPPALLARADALQAFLTQQHEVQELFNGGVLAYRLDGTAVAAMPPTAGREGLNSMDMDAVAAALRDGRAMVGAPVMDKALGQPVFGMTVPIRDAQGRVVGALAGVTHLGQPNFLDQVFDQRYGMTGGYFLVAPQQRRIVAATDKKRVMEALPAPGINAEVDQNVLGFEGHKRMINPLGVEQLVAVKRVPVAGWYLLAALPTTEAFAPVRAMQQRVVLITLFLTVLLGGLMWWMLRRQLAPMLAAMKVLAQASGRDQIPPPLPIKRQDEIGHFIGSFNRLIAALGEREVALREGHDNLRSILDTTLDGYWQLDSTGRLRDVNPAYCDQSGYSREELLRLSIPDLEARERAVDTEAHIQSIIARGHDQFESQHRRKNGSIWHVEVSVTYRDVAGGQFFVFLRDITERKLAEQAQKELLDLNVERDFLSAIVESTGNAITSVDLNGLYTSWNHGAELMFGYRAQEMLGRSIFLLMSEEDAQFERARLQRVAAGESVDGVEAVRIHRDGRAVYLSLSISPIRDDSGQVVGVSRVAQDISKLKLTEQALKHSLADKEALLKEVHHRVKNNLQVITSLLRLEAGRSLQPDTRNVLGEMQGRIRSMALLHESLYRSGTFAGVDLGSYLKQLATQVFRAQGTHSDGVRLQLELASVQVGMDHATPCGLLVNELISNSLKHGFPHGRGGEIRVTLALQADGTRLRLGVSDNGVGLPADFEARRSQSLGLQLVADLAGQLGSSLQVESGPGAAFSVSFDADQPRTAPAGSAAPGASVPAETAYPDPVI